MANPDARPPLTFPPTRIDTPDGLRAFDADLRAVSRTLEPAPHLTQEAALERLWYSLIQSQESRPRHGTYSLLLPRLLRLQPTPPTRPPPPTKPKPLLYTGRLTLSLSNPRFTPDPTTPGAFLAPHIKDEECVATLAVIDIRLVRNIPAAAAAPQAPPHRPSQQAPTSLMDYIQWAASEFHSVFLSPQPQPPPASQARLAPVFIHDFQII